MIAYLRMLHDNWYYYTAGLPEGGKGSSGGDNGGPLVTRATGVDTGYSLVGVSLGLSGGRPRYDFYTEVSHYLPWIADQFGLTFPSTVDTLGRRNFKKNKKNKKRKQKNKKKMQKSRKGQ